VFLYKVWLIIGRLVDTLATLLVEPILLKAKVFPTQSDRQGISNSSVSFSAGYLQAADGVYFKGDFTVAFWFKFASEPAA